MLYLNIKDRNDTVTPVWLDEGGEITLSTSDGLVCAKFYTEPEGHEVELCFHPAMLKMLMAWAEAQPPHTFMAKEGKAERIAELDAFSAEWANRHRVAADSQAAASKRDGIDYPF